jgi:TRAP-type C4-dicarboxylate transport system permease small subunit
MTDTRAKTSFAPNRDDRDDRTDDSRYRRWDCRLAAALLAVMVVVSFVNVLGRYLFHYSLAFTEEVTINLFVWVTVLGSGIAFERGSHLGMITLFRLFPRRFQQGLLVWNAALGAGLFLVVDLSLLRAVYLEITLFHATSPALGLPIWIYYAGVVLLSPAVFLGILRGCRTELRRRSETSGGD